MTTVTTNFTKLPNRLINRDMANLSSGALKIISLIFSCTNINLEEWKQISYAMFKKICGITSNSTIATALKELEQNGFLLISKKKFGSSLYRIAPKYIESCKEPEPKEKNKDDPVCDKSVDSNNCTSRDTNIVPAVEKTCTKTVDIRDVINTKTTTITIASIRRDLGNRSNDLIFTPAFLDDIATFLKANSFGVGYIAYLYDGMMRRCGRVRNRTGYLKSLMESHANLDDYYNSLNDSASISSKKQCPICDQLSEDSYVCSRCGSRIHNASVDYIAQHRVLRAMPEANRRQYYQEIENASHNFADIDLLKKRIAEINGKYGVP